MSAYATLVSPVRSFWTLKAQWKDLILLGVAVPRSYPPNRCAAAALSVDSMDGMDSTDGPRS